MVHYLQTGWTRPRLQALFVAEGMTPKTDLRVSNTDAAALGRPGADDKSILAQGSPTRPIVCTPRGVALCRPSDKVLPSLENRPLGPLLKKDGARRFGQLLPILPQRSIGPFQGRLAVR